MDETIPILRFSFKEDLPRQHYQCFQVLDGSIFYFGDNNPIHFFVVTRDGKRIDGDISILDDLLDHLNKERENWTRRCMQASVQDDKIFWDEISKISYDEQIQSFPDSPCYVETKERKLLFWELHQSIEEEPMKVIEIPNSKEDGYRVFFRDTLFLIRNSTRIQITRLTPDIVEILMPFNLLVDKLTTHGYSDCSTLYLVNSGKDFLLSINTIDLSHRLWKFDRAANCSFDTFDYSVGIRDNLITARF
ncbi:hypothetical protein PENTCL1PPCAC_11865, partial [Pristionchus entomophagus]